MYLKRECWSCCPTYSKISLKSLCSSSAIHLRSTLRQSMYKELIPPLTVTAKRYRLRIIDGWKFPLVGCQGHECSAVLSYPSDWSSATLEIWKSARTTSYEKITMLELKSNDAYFILWREINRTGSRLLMTRFKHTKPHAIYQRVCHRNVKKKG